MIEIVIKYAKSMLTTVLEQHAENTKDAITGAARDMVGSAIAGRRTADEWAEIIIDGVDEIKDKVIAEDGLSFIGGKLKFALSPKNLKKVLVSFELYFQDENGQWQKVGADSNLNSTNFTAEALREMESRGEISFEVEE